MLLDFRDSGWSLTQKMNPKLPNLNSCEAPSARYYQCSDAMGSSVGGLRTVEVLCPASKSSEVKVIFT